MTEKYKKLKKIYIKNWKTIISVLKRFKLPVGYPLGENN